jgi:PAS domain S-box-containing protein
MRAIRDIPIKQKLVIIIMMTTTVALLLLGTGIVVSDLLLFRGYLERDLNTLAGIIADNSTASLAFNDSQSASETLGALRARTHLVNACIFRMDGTMLAQYTRKNTHAVCSVAGIREGLQVSWEEIRVFRSITLNGQKIGTLMLQYDLDEITERVKLYGATVICFVLAATLVAFLLSSKLSKLIATPVSQLVRATTAVAETSDYSIRAQRLSGDELGVLVDRFNEMLSNIQARDTNLRNALLDREEALSQAETARERFRFMAESMPQKSFTAKPNGNVDYFNLQWTEFTGLSFDEIKDWGWTRFIHPDDLETNVQRWRRSVETGEPFHFQHRLRRADGAYRWHLSRAHAMREPNGAISMWIGSDTDIHEQKEKEEELRRLNDDLQQFAYSASHDLQEPIRNVAVYSEVVAAQYHDLLDDDGRQYLGFLVEGGRRLATLINDLLAYTRAGVIEGAITSVDSSVVLKHTLSSLAEAIRETDATVTSDSLPEVYMAEAHLQQVLQNLLSNALKYRNEDPPQIHLSAVNLGAAWRFSVQDNGIGIDPQYKEKIFGVFKRLHRDQKYPGTGIGLAISHRVVERYGGRIWVESEPGKGATFFFTIPHREPRSRSLPIESSVG